MCYQETGRGRSSMVEHQLPKLKTGVRFPSPAPIFPRQARGGFGRQSDQSRAQDPIRLHRHVWFRQLCSCGNVPSSHPESVMRFSKQITVNASAEKVWDVAGRDFANIGVWSTAVSHSVANNDLAPVNNSPVGGRLCDTSIGKISEEFTAYDDDKRTFSFKGVFDSKILQSVTNTTELTSIDENTTRLTITPNIELSFIGVLMSPMIRMQLSKLTDQLLDDLKYYVENGKPSPSKLAAQKKS